MLSINAAEQWPKKSIHVGYIVFHAILEKQ